MAGIWEDDDATEFSTSLSGKKFQRTSTNDDSLREMEARLGVDPDEIKYDTLSVPFSSSFRIGGLKDRKSLTFSVANGGIHKKDISTSNHDAFFGDPKKRGFYVVTKVEFSDLKTSFQTPNGLTAVLPSVRTTGKQSYGAQTDGVARFNVRPNTAKPGELETPLDPRIFSHLKDHPGQDKAYLQATYGKLGKTGEQSWVDKDAPFLDLLDADRLTAPDAKTDFYVYNGPHTEVEQAAIKIDEIQKNHLAYSDLAIDKLALELHVPPSKEFDETTELHTIKEPSFYELVKSSYSKNGSAPAQRPKEPKAAEIFDKLNANFDNGRVEISGKQTFTLYYAVPKFEVRD